MTTHSLSYSKYIQCCANIMFLQGNAECTLEAAWEYFINSRSYRLLEKKLSDMCCKILLIQILWPKPKQSALRLTFEELT